jgi:hypothetical protein
MVVRPWEGRVIVGRCDWAWELALTRSAKTVIALRARMKRSQIGAELHRSYPKRPNWVSLPTKSSRRCDCRFRQCPFHKKPEITLYQNGVDRGILVGCSVKLGRRLPAAACGGAH